MKNIPTLDELKEMPISALQEFSPDMFIDYYNQIDIINKAYAKVKSNLDTALINKYDLDVETIGTSNKLDGDCNIKNTVGKNVSWDQDKLRAKGEEIETVWKRNPDEYIDVTLKVSETKFNAWPDDIKSHFIDARTVKPAKAKIEISRKEVA